MTTNLTPAILPNAAAVTANPFDFASTAKSVHDSIDAATAAIPADHDGAFLLRGTTVNGQNAVQAVVATKIGSDWKFAAGATWTGGKHVDGEVALVGSWTWPK